MKIFFTLFISLISLSAISQISPGADAAKKLTTIQKDTVIESDTSKENKEPRYFYISPNVNVFVNTKGTAGKRVSPSCEFGRTYGIFDLGISIGTLNVLKGSTDTARYIELRPTINIFQKGRFAESLCLGAGYVISAKQGLMTEICNGVNFNVSPTFAVAILQGYMFFDGTNSSRGTQYIGINLTFNFLRNHSVNRQRKKAVILNDN